MDHPVLQNNQLADVICQLRFPQIDSIGSEPPAELQRILSDRYPLYSVRKEVIPPKITGGDGNLNINTQPAVYNHQFMSQDKVWRINITNGFFSIACSEYERWRTFADRLDKPLASFISIYHPQSFTRVGLRYLNFISRKSLGLEELPFRELIQMPYLGYLGKADVPEQDISQCTTDVQIALSGGCRAKLHTGPGLTARNGQQDPEVKFVFDLDLFLGGNIPVNVSVGAMQTLHDQAFPIFRDAITDTLFDALK